MELKVSATSKPQLVAGAIAAEIRHSGKVEIDAIGMGAVNQAVKAIAVARGYVVASGIDIACIPSFRDLSIDGIEVTGIRFKVFTR